MISVVFAFFETNGFLVEMLLSMALFVWWVERRQHFALRVAASLCVMLAASTVAGLLAPLGLLMLIVRCLVIYAVCYLALMVCWNLTASEGLFYFAASCAMQHFAYRGGMVMVTLLRDVTDAGWVDTVGYALVLVPFLAGGWYAFARPLKGLRINERDWGNLVPLLIGLVVCTGVFAPMFDEYGGDVEAPAYLAFMLFDLMTCLFLLALLREIAQRETAQRDGETLSLMLSQQKTQLESDKETIDLINVKTHDLKHQLTLLGDRIPAEEIDELTSLVGIYDSSVHTGNEALDVLLANKSLVCEQRGIQFDRMIDGARLGFMRQADIYALFGNALDNAIEAVSAVRRPERRYIRITVRENRGMVVIHAENPFDGEREFHDGLPATTKGDRDYHGFGMRSMRMIAERYGGVMKAAADDGVFSVNIMMPLPE